MKFKSQFNNFTEKTSLDYSNQYEQTYVELEPYARNDKGEFLNDSPFPKLVPGDKINVQERIDSYFEEVDLYHILAKVASTGDLSYLDKKAGFYGDISNIPNNYNDINSYFKNIGDEFKKLPSEIKDLINSEVSDDEFNEGVNNYINSKNNVNNVNNNNESEIDNNENK